MKHVAIFIVATFSCLSFANYCWNACEREGFNAAYCASHCGVATEDACGQCWDKCVSEGFLARNCAPMCGTFLATGRDACWRKCQTETPFPTSQCTNLCGP